jgi:hypothetical protein
VLNLECEVAHYLIHFCEELVSLFPEARFIHTVRHPRPWLRSFIDQSINLDQNFSEHLSNEEVEAWRCLRRINCGPSPNVYPAPEDPLAKCGLPSIDGYLSYWAHHNQQVLDGIPTDRRLLVRTCDLSNRVDDIRAFAGADGDVGKKPHANQAHEKHNVFQQIDEDYVNDRIDVHCSGVLRRLYNLGMIFEHPAA